MEGGPTYKMTPVAVPKVKTRYRRIVTNSLPLSAVIGRTDVMNRYAPGSMTSTHSASPVAAAAALEDAFAEVLG